MSQTSSQITIDAIPQQVWVANQDGQIIDINAKVSIDFGLQKQEIIKKGWLHLFIHRT